MFPYGRMEGYWKIYFLTHHQNYAPFLEKLAKVCERAIFYFHPGGKKDPDRPHIHGLLRHCTVRDKTVREWIRKEFNLPVNEAEYAVSREYKEFTTGKKLKMTDLSYPKYITYMSKGQYDPVYSKGFEPEEFTMAKMCWSEPKKDEAITLVIEPKEKVKKKMTQFEISYESEIRYIEAHGDNDIDWHTMYYIVKNVCKENKTRSDDNTMAYIIQDIQSRLEPDKQWARIQKRIG